MSIKHYVGAVPLPPPVVPNYVPLSRDDARLALWQAIESINIGNKTDDKLILAELCKRNIYLCSAAPEE